MTLNQMLVFCVLMQNITGKAPSYIEEKHNQVQKFTDPSVLLDAANKAVYDEWVNTWGYMLQNMSKHYGFSEEVVNAGR